MSEGRESNPNTYTRLDFLGRAAGLLVPLSLMDAAKAAGEALAPRRERFTAQPTWEQDFSKEPDGPLNPKYWNVVHGENGIVIASYNGEQQKYTDDLKNVRIENKLLIIEARAEDNWVEIPQSNGSKKRELLHYTSGRINTQGKFESEYGKIEVVAKIPDTKGTWPAVWELPNSPKYSQSKYGVADDLNNGWVLNGEIDIEESVAAEPGYDDPDAHTYASEPGSKHKLHAKQLTKSVILPHQFDRFHKYGLQKTPSGLTFLIDDKVVYKVKRVPGDARYWPFDQAYYPIINLAVGGDWAGEKGIDKTGFPCQMKIAHIAYYPLIK